MKTFLLATAFTAGILVTGTAYAASTLTNPSEVMIDNATVNQGVNSRAANLRANVRSLMQEHTVTAASYLKDLYDGKDTAQIKENLNANSTMISNLVGEAYGNGAKTRFSNMWNMHVVGYESYVKAARSSDSEAMSNVRDTLHEHAQKMEDEFDDLNNTSVSRFSEMMTQHVDGTLALVDAYAEGNEAQVANLMKEGFTQSGEFADYLISILVTEKPNLLK